MTANPSARYLAYRLTLQSPLIVTNRQGDPNSAATQSFISGSSIRGIVASRLLSTGVDPESEEFGRLVLSGQVRYLNAHLEIGAERSLPIPLSWRVSKSDKSRCRDLACYSGPPACTTEEENLEEYWPVEQLEPPSWEFVSPRLTGDSWMATHPKTGSRIHHQRDRGKGRAWKDQEGRVHGAIFTYEFLEPGQSFRGVIQLMAGVGDCEARLRELLARPVVIGRSRRAGYGGDAKLEFLPGTPREYAGATGLLDRDLKAQERFRILLVSPSIVRHPETGQVDPVAIENEICRRLNGAVQIERRRWAFETVGSFNQKWGLELPQACAVQSGSVFVVRARQQIPLQELLTLEHEGLGERRVEGFGRLVLLAHDDEHRRMRLQETRAQPAEHRQLAPAQAPDHPLLDLLERRLVLEAAENELHRAAFRLAVDVKRAPAKALLGRLRTLLRDAQEEARAQTALGRLNGWLEEWEQSDQKAARQLKDCRLKGQNLLEWLKPLLARGGPASWEALRQAAGESSDLAALSQKHCLRTPASAKRILEQHAATLTVTFLDALFAAISRKEVS